MAIFNPNVPDTQDPNYLGYSKVVEAPPPDKTLGMALSTVGSAIEGAVNLTDSWIKKNITEEVRNSVDTQRDAYTSALENAATTLKVNQTPNQSLVAQDNPEGAGVPTSLQASIDKAEAIGGGRAQGKINDTYYTMNLNSEAKRLRAEYPGYKDFIDEKFSAISGMNPANAYYKNIMADINQQLSKSNDGTKAIASAVLEQAKAGVPGMDKVYMGMQNGTITPAKALERVNQNKATEYKYNAIEAERKARAGVRQDNIDQTTPEWTNEAAETAANAFSNTLTVPGLTNPSTIVKLADDAMNGRVQLTDTQQGWLVDSLRAQARTVRANLDDLANKRGVTAVLGPQKVKELNDNAMKKWTDAIDFIGNKEYGSAFSAMRTNTSIVNDTKRDLLTAEGGIAGMTAATAAFSSLYGPNFMNITQTQFLKNSTAMGNMDDWFKSRMFKSAVPDDVRKDNVSKSLMKDISDAQEISRSGRAVVPPVVYNNLIDNVVKITAPDSSPMFKGMGTEKVNAYKREIASYAFNPQNLGLMDKFAMDYVDSNGKLVKGKYSVFTRLTQPDMTDNIWKVSGNNKNDTVWRDYVNTGENWFNKLYREDIQTLNQVQEDKMSLRKIAWDNKNHQFVLTDDKNVPVSDQKTLVGRTINRLNWGISNLSRVHEKEGGDTEAYILKTLYNFGFRPDAAISGIPQQMLDTVAASKNFAKRWQDTIGK